MKPPHFGSLWVQSGGNRSQKEKINYKENGAENRQKNKLEKRKKRQKKGERREDKIKNNRELKPTREKRERGMRTENRD